MLNPDQMRDFDALLPGHSTEASASRRTALKAALGVGYTADYDAVMQASLCIGMDDQQVKAQMRQMIDVQPSVMNFVQKILQVQLSH